MIEQSTGPVLGDVRRWLTVWRKHYGLARRSEDPVTAAACAALSTGETLRRFDYSRRRWPIPHEPDGGA